MIHLTLCAYLKREIVGSLITFPFLTMHKPSTCFSPITLGKEQGDIHLSCMRNYRSENLLIYYFLP